jgi:hypothetical protein
MSTKKLRRILKRTPDYSKMILKSTKDNNGNYVGGGLRRE